MNKKRLAAALTGAAIFAGTATGIAVASIPAPGGAVHGCYSNLTGSLKVIDSSASCGALQTSLNWNQTGPVGPQGPVGAQGVQGVQGLKGDKGDTGSSGPSSLIGYSQHVTNPTYSDSYYTYSCPSGYYASSFYAVSDDQSSTIATMTEFGNFQTQVFVPFAVPYTAYTGCAYYGSVTALSPIN